MCLCQGPVSVRSNLTEEPMVTRVHETVHGRGLQIWPPKSCRARWPRSGLVRGCCSGDRRWGRGALGAAGRFLGHQALAPLPRGPSRRSPARNIRPREDLICHRHSGQQCPHLCPGESTVMAAGRTLLGAPECPTASSVCTHVSAREHRGSLGAARTGMWTGRGVPRCGRVWEPLCLSGAPSRVGHVGWPWTSSS